MATMRGLTVGAVDRLKAMRAKTAYKKFSYIKEI